MIHKSKVFTLLLASVFLLAGCNPSKDSLKQMLKENPDIITESIKENPIKFLDAFQAAAKVYQEKVQKERMEEQKKRYEEEQKQIEEAYTNPLKPTLNDKDAFIGSKNGPIVLVKYSDFQCGYCAKAYQTVQQLMSTYKGKFKYIFKHLPMLSPNSLLAAQYFEAIKLQSMKKAFAFHDYLYLNQGQIRRGKDFLDKAAKKVGANLKKIESTMNSREVMEKINTDKSDAERFGIQGTPGFVMNGIPVKGARGPAHFEDIVEKLKGMGKLKL